MENSRLMRGGKSFSSVANVLVTVLFMSCSCLPCAKSKSSLVQPQRDSVMIAAVGDSVYQILASPKRIDAMAIDLSKDSVGKAQTASFPVKKKYRSLLHFILSDPQLYGGDVTTFGHFLPCFKLTFIKGGECCILNFDFGLKKWTISDHTGQVIKRFDQPSDHMLRFANMLFPEFELYKDLLNTNKR